MKFLAVLAALALAAEAYEPIFYNYHEEIGIPMAARIKAAEEAIDFDGARIAGGTPSNLGANPHLGGLLISLTDNRDSVCGSSLVSNTRLVTAAHCWRHRTSQGRQLTVVLGSTRLFFGGTRINSNQVDTHAQFNHNNLNFDIAVIRISHVAYTANINRILIPAGNNQYVGVWAVAAGYGRTSETAIIGPTQTQRQVSMQVISNAVCQRQYGANIVTAGVLCTAAPGGRSTCPGDSGGPLAIGSGNNRELIGVKSFNAASGCTRGLPAGFMRVTFFTAWIRQRM